MFLVVGFVLPPSFVQDMSPAADTLGVNVVPSAPFVPGWPFRFLNSKSNTFDVLGPLAVIVTEGVPTFASTEAVGVPKPAAAPTGPVEPLSDVLLPVRTVVESTLVIVYL